MTKSRMTPPAILMPIEPPSGGHRRWVRPPQSKAAKTVASGPPRWAMTLTGASRSWIDLRLAPEFDGPEDTLSDFERFIDGLATYPETGVSLGQLSTRRTGPGARV